MSTKELAASIVDLPDEVLLRILNNLPSFDVLHALVGVNGRLDRLACDSTFTRAVDLMTIEPIRMAQSTPHATLDRFCVQVFPRIQQQMESLTLQSCFFLRVFRACTYPRLCKLVIVDLELTMARQLFNDNATFVRVYKEQISDLVITNRDEVVDESQTRMLTDVYHRLFSLFTDLKHLDFDGNDSYCIPRPLLAGFPSTTCVSSSIVHLRIELQNIDDCLHLLDGRLPQLHTLKVNLVYIHDPVLLRRSRHKATRHSWQLLNKVANPLRLKCFSLYAFHRTDEFDGIVLSLIRRMTDLEKLALGLRLSEIDHVVDGTYLQNNLLTHLSHLHTFHFDLLHLFVGPSLLIEIPTPDVIRQTFVDRGYDVACYMTYDRVGVRQCRLYSLSLDLDRMCFIEHDFPGGFFTHVRILCMKDDRHSFEHRLFAVISRSFPSLTRLSIINMKKQEEQHDNPLTMIEFAHLTELCVSGAHLDYVEQFLSDSITSLPSLKRLRVAHPHLVTVTKSFTRNATRRNCAQLKHIVFNWRLTFVHSEEYYAYFPSLF